MILGQGLEVARMFSKIKAREDVLVNVILGAVLRTHQSRAAAAALLASLLVAITIGDGPLFHALLLWPAVRAVEATWKIHAVIPRREGESDVTASSTLATSK